MRLKYRKRAWLNGPGEGDAYISGTIKAQKTYIDGRGNTHDGYVDAVLSIADCSRIVTLDFDVYEKAEAQTRLKKIDLMLDFLTKYRDVLATNAQEVFSD